MRGALLGALEHDGIADRMGLHLILQIGWDCISFLRLDGIADRMGLHLILQSPRPLELIADGR